MLCLGLTLWYAEFIPNYGFIIEQFKQLLHGTSSLMWTAAAQASFDTVKALLVPSPASALFDRTQLTQHHEGKSEKTG